MKFIKIFAMIVILMSVVGLVMLGRKELPIESYSFSGENMNGKVMLIELADGYEIQFYPSDVVESYHQSNDSYGFNFYNDKNEIALNSGLTVFDSELNGLIHTRIIGTQKKIPMLNRVTITTKNAVYSIDLKKQ